MGRAWQRVTSVFERVVPAADQRARRGEAWRYVEWLAGRFAANDGPAPRARIWGLVVRFLLSSDRGRLARLSSRSSDNLIQLAQRWRRRQAETARGFDLGRIGRDELLSFSDGFAWVVVPASSLELEGWSMHHCVATYRHDVECGMVTILSLRDSQNRPLVTVEIAPR